ncbi:MAG: hypothetical protein K0R71_1305 [Bacillales bacterium]|nr:hypothetical protein [Bacillales bacterium]
MGREFLHVFTDWASEYDSSIQGHDKEYAEVFRNYPTILKIIADKAGNSVIEFGSGTGNLTKELILKNKQVYPVEPSPEMREIANNKPELQHITFIDGDMEHFPKPNFIIDTIVSTFVFHHLNGDEKQRVIQQYYDLLPPGGKIIFGDTMFLSEASHFKKINTALEENKLNLAKDLQREYYPLIPDIETYFTNAGFTTRFIQMNSYVWIVEAQK